VRTLRLVVTIIVANNSAKTLNLLSSDPGFHSASPRADLLSPTSSRSVQALQGFFLRRFCGPGPSGKQGAGKPLMHPSKAFCWEECTGRGARNRRFNGRSPLDVTRFTLSFTGKKTI